MLHHSILSYILIYSRVMAPDFVCKLYDSDEFPDKKDLIPTAYDVFSLTYFGVHFLIICLHTHELIDMDGA